MNLPNKKYNIIYADPPWDFRGCKNNKSMSAEAHYPTMTIKDICSIPVKDIVADDAVLLMWVTNPILYEAEPIFNAWGFKYKTIAFNWHKTTKHNKEAITWGFWTLGSTELCLLGARGKSCGMKQSHKVRQYIEAERTKHSAKPPEIRDRIVKMMGDLPRIELFARDVVDGWDNWGNEI